MLTALGELDGEWGGGGLGEGGDSGERDAVRVMREKRSGEGNEGIHIIIIINNNT